MTGFLIAGTSSGVGKTTVTLALIAAFKQRGLIVQPFKGGPDFLDTGHQTLAAGRASRNIDTWMLDEESNRAVLQAGAGADVLIVEGMMGLFDGKDGATDAGSSAEIARILDLPVVLVLDAGKSARSIAAVVLGFELFDPTLKLAGVILNRVASERHFQMLQAAIQSRCNTPLLGWLPRESSIAIAERHLGLHTAEEQSAANNMQRLHTLAVLAEQHLDLNALLALQCGITLDRQVPTHPTPGERIRIGVARDEAFSFYYEDNFDLLREAGAEIVLFSPIHDSVLPQGLDALYLGGGYPELHATALSSNGAMLQAVHHFAASGRPIYAECGGMIYLGQSLRMKDGSITTFAGILPISFEMTERLVRFGYVTVELTSDCLLGPAGTTLRGHSFHYSRISPDSDLSAMSKAYRIAYSLSGHQEMEGFEMEGSNVLASYIHIHFRANRAIAANFVEAARMARRNMMVTA